MDSFCSPDRIAATCENGRARKDGNPIDNVRICDVEDIKKVLSTAVGEL